MVNILTAIPALWIYHMTLMNYLWILPYDPDSSYNSTGTLNFTIWPWFLFLGSYGQFIGTRPGKHTNSLRTWSHGSVEIVTCPMNSMVDLSISRTVQLPGRVNLHVPMVFLWFSYGFPMENGGSFHSFLFVYQRETLVIVINIIHYCYSYYSYHTLLL